MENITEIKKYAFAIYHTSVRDGISKKLSLDFLSFISFAKNTECFSKVLLIPSSPKNFKKIFLNQLINDTGLEDTMLSKVLNVLVEHNKLHLLIHIHKEFENLLMKSDNKVIVNLFTARDVSQNLKKSLVELMSSMLNKDVSITHRYDESLMSGMLLRFENYMIDASVQRYFCDFSKWTSN